MARTYHPRGVLVDGFAVQDHPLYVTWANMLSRCYNKKCKAYVNYGGRGISVCERWHHFANFIADMPPRPDGMTLSRIDNNGNYEPKNCTWDTSTDQCVNRRRFSNNTTGITGVVRIETPMVRYEARFDYEGVRYHIGRFDTVEEAQTHRAYWLTLWEFNRPAAVAIAQRETLWATSSTKVRGVTPHKDGGYIARATIDGKRHYVGYFKSVEEANDARIEFVAARTSAA